MIKYIRVKKVKKIFKAIIITLSLSLCILSTGNLTDTFELVNNVNAATIQLNSTSKKLCIGVKYQLKVKGTTHKVTWSSNNKSIATVSSSGKVTAKNKGKCKIYAKVDGKTLSCSIEVVKTKISKEKVVCINAGHQAKANNEKEAIGPGSSTKKKKVSSGTAGYATRKKESVVNLGVAKKLEKELKARGYKVIMVRNTQDINISNKERALKGNEASITISLHCDGSNNHSTVGAHTICIKDNNPYYKDLYSPSKKLAEEVINSYCKMMKIKNRGVSKRNDLTGLNWSRVPAIYIEMGFMTNKAEDKKISNSDNWTKMAKGIADGIDSYWLCAIT